MYTIHCQATTSTVDSTGHLKLYSALQMMQDCSELWLDSQPQVRDFFESQNMAQLLASRQVEIVRVPTFKEHLTVTTSVYEVKPMFGFRNTFIYDSDGQPCYRTWSMGAFVDKNTGRLKRVPDSVATSLLLDTKLPMDYKDRRIILPDVEGMGCEPIRVMRADIDYNRHVNNAVYVRMAMELLPESFAIGGLRVEYRSAAHLGHTLLPTLYTLDHSIIVTLATATDTCAIIEFIQA